MRKYFELMMELYSKELQQDRALLHGLIQQWIIIPRDTSMYTYMAMYGLFGCVIRIVILLLVRVPVWWPMQFIAYVINCVVRYMFVPVYAWLHIQLNKAYMSNHTVYIKVYTHVITAITWVEWILKTVFLFTYVIEVIVTWWHTRRSVRAYIYHKMDQIVVKAHALRNEKQKQGRGWKLLQACARIWTTHVVGIPKLLIAGVKIIYKYINPLNYKWVKYVVYTKHRQHLLLIVKCRIIIRYGLFKGWVAYAMQGWLWVKLRRWVRLLRHVCCVISIKYHPKLALLTLIYWVTFHIWWISNFVYRHMGYCYIYVIGGLWWVAQCVALIMSPVLYALLYVAYVINALNIWWHHGLWVCKSSFYLMLGFNPNPTQFKGCTRMP